MRDLRVFLSCDPPKTSHHAKRIVKRGKFSSLADKPELVAAKQTIDALLLPHQIVAPIVGPYRLTLTFTWPWLKGHSQKFRAAGRQRCTSKPDLDNASKSVTDRLVQLRFIEDDNAVVELHVAKWWGSRPGIEIEIESLVPMTVEQARTRERIDSDLFEVAGPIPAGVDG